MTRKIVVDYKAQFLGGWAFSIFGNPKLEVITGCCDKYMHTREWISDRHGDIILQCSVCNKWNHVEGIQAT